MVTGTEKSKSAGRGRRCGRAGRGFVSECSAGDPGNARHLHGIWCAGGRRGPRRGKHTHFFVFVWFLFVWLYRQRRRATQVAWDGGTPAWLQRGRLARWLGGPAAPLARSLRWAPPLGPVVTCRPTYRPFFCIVARLDQAQHLSIQFMVNWTCCPGSFTASIHIFLVTHDYYWNIHLVGVNSLELCRL
jgi:hypothetical protein